LSEDSPAEVAWVANLAGCMAGLTAAYPAPPGAATTQQINAMASVAKRRTVVITSTSSRFRISMTVTLAHADVCHRPMVRDPCFRPASRAETRLPSAEPWQAAASRRRRRGRPRDGPFELTVRDR
jgi:hypothetical protein